MAKPVRATPGAEIQILELDAWWREHRDKAPDLFEQELSLAFRTIGAAPAAGKRYSHSDAEVRRVLMRSTRHHVYYVDRDDHVLVAGQLFDDAEHIGFLERGWELLDRRPEPPLSLDVLDRLDRRGFVAVWGAVKGVGPDLGTL